MYVCISELLPPDSENYASTLTSIESDIAQKSHIQTKTRPFVHTVLNFFGLSVEYMCASLFVTRLKPNCMRDQATGRTEPSAESRAFADPLLSVALV
jgi:hypothetical protein